ncbi:protein CLEC16A isoform X2 [Nematostella vectensis]|uniref:protein CLEC16A isoform X2 n=1 Tax=Nematostella vectensis TaxID=45351 RepID=UPI0020774920|nr:protein CLEC16A isoform X2 [Nematostella vectensis]
MFQRQRNWISDVLWRPKKAHSLEQLRYLHYVLNKNSTINETNRGLLVETLRSIAEILIWGDQNDSRVFDFFLEKNMLMYFHKMMNQRSNNQICTQLLQTLSILFENIRNETSLYYLLSNNHVNSIIIHKFDFSDEEVLAYYISFLKTLSLKLNTQTIHFFFNERKNDFPLYTEAIKFFNHSESMVRIAVRTLTLNVYKVGDQNMLNFIRDKTADPYFWNLVWFIGNHAIELDNCAQKEADHLRCNNLKDIVADHLDHLHYLHDILSLDIQDLSCILTEHLLDRLLIPLYVYSLVKRRPDAGQDTPRISSLVSLFLLSQIMLIMSYPPLVSSLVDIILNGDEVDLGDTPEASPLPLKKAGSKSNSVASIRTFQGPEQTLEESLVARGVNTEGYMFLDNKRKLRYDGKDFEEKSTGATKLNGVTVPLTDTPLGAHEVDSLGAVTTAGEATKHLTTDEKPNWREQSEDSGRFPIGMQVKSFVRRCADFNPDRLFFEALRNSLECSNNDGEALFALCVVHAAINNRGVDKRLLHSAGISSIQEKVAYNEPLVDDIIRVLDQGCRNGSRVRTVTVEMAIILLKQLVQHKENDGKVTSYLLDNHLALIENVREASTLQLRHFYKEDEMFLDMFEDEFRQMKSKPLNVEHLMMDATLLLPITGTPLTGIEFSKRLPCGEVEHTRRAIRVFLMMRELCLALMGRQETRLPLSKVEYSVHLEDVLDLNNSDLISCTVKTEDKRMRRFLVIDEAQFILVEPDTTKLGWGVVKFVARLQDVETAPDKEDSRSLFITIHQPFAVRSLTKVHARPILSAKFVFDDYIRCMSARQRLQRRRTMLKQDKLHNIAQLLELPAMATPPSHYYTITPPAYINMGSSIPYVASPSHDSSSSSDSGHRYEASALAQSGTPSKGRSTSQAQALANVLEQSPPESQDRDLDSRTRAISIEQAEDALEMVPRSESLSEKSQSHPVLDRFRDQVSISDYSSSEPSSRSDSLENICGAVRAAKNKYQSQSAPATPRGGRHEFSMNPDDEYGGFEVSCKCMSDPALMFTQEWQTLDHQPKQTDKARKSSKNNGGKKKTNRRKKTNSKRRSTK